MELKCGSINISYLDVYSSNRTFMELKFISEELTNGAYFVLIVPLWN